MRLLFTIIGFQSTSAPIFQPNEEKPEKAKDQTTFCIPKSFRM
jgi:hypothetical protein